MSGALSPVRQDALRDVRARTTWPWSDGSGSLVGLGRCRRRVRAGSSACGDSSRWSILSPLPVPSRQGAGDSLERLGHRRVEMEGRAPHRPGPRLAGCAAPHGDCGWQRASAAKGRMGSRRRSRSVGQTLYRRPARTLLAREQSLRPLVLADHQAKILRRTSRCRGDCQWAGKMPPTVSGRFCCRRILPYDVARARRPRHRKATGQDSRPDERREQATPLNPLLAHDLYLVAGGLVLEGRGTVPPAALISLSTTTSWLGVAPASTRFPVRLRTD